LAIHPTAIVHSKAELDSSVEVGPHCVIDAHVRVSSGCRLYHGVYLTGWTEIGEDCELHPGAIVGHAPQDAKYSGARSYCRIGRGTILREYVTVHRGTIPESETVVGEDCFLLAGAHVGHNCAVGKGVTLINNVLLGGHVIIEERATIGGAVGIHQFTRVGELAMIAGTARVTMDVIPFALADANGRISGLNRVGLRRANIPPEHVVELREAYRLLFASGLRLSEAVQKLGAAVRFPPGERLARFLQHESKRGIAGASRTRKRPGHNSVPE
jgi:UDP-N-acetylglucosamine acyltransferase